MNTNDIPVIELFGQSRNRGQIYGETVRHLMANNIASWRSSVGNFFQDKENFGKYSPAQYIEQFLSDTCFIPAIERWAPDVLEEVRGIAEGANQSFEDVLALQLIDEEWVYGLRRHSLEKPVNKCTAFGLSDHPGAVVWAGQNMDIPSWVEGSQVLLRIKQEGLPEQLVFCFAGNIGLNGLNAAGIGVTCNTLANLNNAGKGLPVAFVLRALLKTATIDHAEHLLRRIPHASGQNYIVSSPQGCRCFECSASTVERYVDGDEGRVFHSNHPFVNNDRCAASSMIEKRFENSEARFNSLSSRLSKGLVSIDTIKTALSAHDDPVNPVSRVLNAENIKSSIGFTAGSSIYEIADKPKYHLAAGPPCETSFRTFEFGVMDKRSSAIED